MRTEPAKSDVKKRLSQYALAVDAFVNSSAYEHWRRLRDGYLSFSAFMDRFHVTGVKRLAVELACEGLTLGLGVSLIALTFAQLAFRETSADWLKKQDLAVTFTDRYGAEVGRRGIRHDDSVTLDQLPDHLINAVLATEDRRFFDHWGIDPIGTARALLVNARSSNVVQGGSTITQQLAKNLFLTNERSIERKIREAYLALWLEFHLPKREILKLYLDRAYMGGGNFGVQAAAQFYFGKSAKDVSLAEAAMLAGLFKAPTKYAPHINLPAARARAADVLNNLVDAGFMNQSQIFTALRNPATAIERPQQTSPDWYLDWAFEQVKKLADSGKFGDDRVLFVRTALDSALQAHAESVIEDQLRESGRRYHAKQAAMVVIEPSSGAVRAIVGGRDYGVSQFNRATDALRQTGSSFKPYVYLSALMTGKFRPSTIVTDSPVCIGTWCPHNYGGSFSGSMPLASALARSLNTVAVKLSIAIGNIDPRKTDVGADSRRGRQAIVDTARKMGVTAPLSDTVSLPLGVGEISVMEHSASYSVFANGGKRVYPYAATEIRNSKGDILYRQDRDAPQPARVFPDTIIADMNSMLAKVVEEGTGKRAILDDPIQVGGKTGTTNGYRDAWFCGFTGNYNGCVWYGNDDGAFMNNMTGGSLPAETWHDVMAFAHRGVEIKPIPGLPPRPSAPLVVSRTSGDKSELGAPQAPASLSRRTSETLNAIEHMASSSNGKRVDTMRRSSGFQALDGASDVR